MKLKRNYESCFFFHCATTVTIASPLHPFNIVK